MALQSCWIVAYDISCPRRRYRVARLLEDGGRRLQRSVFEVWASPAELAEIELALSRCIDPCRDSVRLYRPGPTPGGAHTTRPPAWLIV